MSWPSTTVERDRFVVAHRPPRAVVDAWRAHGVTVEDERTSDGRVAAVATVFLTGRECPWRCAMCDLWTQTTAEDTPVGAIPAQIAAAIQTIGASVRTIKLYNAGSYFDPRAVPDADDAAVAALLQRFERVIVESHPSLIGPRLDRFLAALRAGHAAPALEVAMGLETAHPEALERLHKRMTLAGFADSARALRQRGVALRVFLLMAPPFVPPDEQLAWLLRSVDAALACDAAVISLIPTRGGNGTLEALAEQGLFAPPTLDDIQRYAAAALERVNRRARLFVDLWDLERFAGDPASATACRSRLHLMNLEQSMPAAAQGPRR